MPISAFARSNREYNAGKSWRCRVSMCKVAIEADRIRAYARKFIKEADAEMDTPSGDFVRGRFLGLSAADLLDLLRLEGLHLHIEGHSYRLLSVEESGTFIGVKEA
jgi:hypothetical protein